MGDLEDDQLLGLRLQSEVDGLLPTLRAATIGNAALIGRPDWLGCGPVRWPGVGTASRMTPGRITKPVTISTC